MKTRILAALLAAVMILSAGCSANSFLDSLSGKKPGSSGSSGEGVQPSSAAQPEYPVTVREAVLASQPQKVVSLSPALTEILFEMGYGDRVVGVSDFCDYPEEAQGLTRCGTPLAPARDGIKALGADLVVSTAALTEEDLVWFQQNGMQVLVLPRAADLSELEALYLDLGTAMEGQTTGHKAARSFYDGLTAQLDEAKGLIAAYRAEKQTLVHAILLREMSYGMATGDTFEQKIFDYLGLTNDAANYGDWLYLEADVAQLNPDFIFCDDGIDTETVRKSRVYSVVPAAKNNRIMNVPLAAFERQSPRMFRAVLEMAQFIAGGGS